MISRNRVRNVLKIMVTCLNTTFDILYFYCITNFLKMLNKKLSRGHKSQHLRRTKVIESLLNKLFTVDFLFILQCIFLKSNIFISFSLNVLVIVFFIFFSFEIYLSPQMKKINP